jgi:type I restriction enzyme R subunit
LGADEVVQYEKQLFKLFDFFANCDYFDKKYDYDEKLILPKPKQTGKSGGGGG